VRLARRRFLGVSLVAPAVLGGGCALRPPPPAIPMQSLRFASSCAGRANTLLVMLPGAYSRAQEFVDEGFVEALARRRMPADVAIVDAHLGYYVERTIVQRLQDDVVAPARASGYRQVWLLGISLGGFGALGHALRHPGGADGLVLLAPYLGSRLLLDEIERAGGPVAWRARTPRPTSGDDLDRELWHWLATPEERRGLPVHLGYGRGDRFAEAHERLRDLLPAERTIDVPGGHDWRAWRELWDTMLDRAILAGSGCADGS
jgi:pimeloyl-ACP methyl ester carboxylesterase